MAANIPIINAIIMSTVMSSRISDIASSNCTVGLQTVNDSNKGFIICSVESHDRAKCAKVVFT